ncbi:hypothetical protein EJ06DRAFT_478301 [Trichodelitschia bisporula]|uniref:Integral membrane protein n=1 Tax=Trichodelitschia bisporula TaxID=703511 RepID=A0A6G1HTN3_9PEZI|nr:hypothetical protein EJ06DRAFT_478301 [Trichodelitschia bisporula]
MLLPGSSPALHTLLTTTLLLTLLTLYGTRSFYRDPGSIFFDPARALERRYSMLREAEALFFHTAMLANATAHPHAGPKPLLCGTLLTVARDAEIHPLELALASALHPFYPAERAALHLGIYFADTNPSQHPTSHSPLLALTDAHTTPVSFLEPAALDAQRALEAEGKLGTKVGHDFAAALRWTLQVCDAPYVALFEGDVLFAEGWMARTAVALRDIEARRKTRAEGGGWLDLRLFNDEGNIGWERQGWLDNHVPLIAGGISIGLWVVLRIVRIKGRKVAPGVTAVLCLVTIPALVIFFFQAGKSSLIPRPAGVSVQNWGCCTQGEVMPRAAVAGLADELERRAGAPPDVVFLEYAARLGWVRYALDPVVMQHVGWRSRLDPGRGMGAERGPGGAVWSMGFEDLKMSRLGREHRDMAGMIWGKEAVG